MQLTENKITTIFKIYDYIVCLNDGFLYQLVTKNRLTTLRK